MTVCPPPETAHLFGYEVVGGGLEGLCARARQIVEEELPRGYLVALNAEKVAIAKEQPELDQLIRRGIAYPDGMPICWAARLLHGVRLDRVTGTDIMMQLCEMAAGYGWKVYLLGARRRINEETRQSLEEAFPGLDVAGSRDGYFDDGESDAVAREIRRSGASLLFVALGSPRQELWIADQFETTGVRFAMGVGGSFDVVAGEKPRAPLFMQRSGLEWAYRVAHEPWRLRRIVPRFASFLSSFAREAWKKVDGGSKNESEHDG